MNKNIKKSYQVIVIGASYGGIKALQQLLPALCKITSLPIIIAQHIKKSHKSILAKQFTKLCQRKTMEARKNDEICHNTLYFAPGDYHLLIEDNNKLSLSMDNHVNFSRPSIDVLFESAADAYANTAIGIILTGSNIDGAAGIKKIYDAGGITIAQNPTEAIAKNMPQAAINTGKIDEILKLADIAMYLKKHLINQQREKS